MVNASRAMSVGRGVLICVEQKDYISDQAYRSTSDDMGFLSEKTKNQSIRKESERDKDRKNDWNRILDTSMIIDLRGRPLAHPLSLRVPPT